MQYPFQSYREGFPILGQNVQLTSCSQSALHHRVRDAVQAYMDSWETKGLHYGFWMEHVEVARQQFADLIHADMEEVAIAPSISHAVCSIATSLDYSGARRELCITDLDFPSVGHALLSQRSSGAGVRFIPSEQGRIAMEQYEREINDQTLLTCVSEVSYANGFKQDVKEIARIAHSKGSYLLVDAYQSVGNMQINVKDSNVDFLVAGTQKYLLGMPGLVFLYVKKELAEQMTPRVTGWFGQADPFSYDIYQTNYAEGALRFDGGTPSMISCFAAREGLSIIQEIGIDPIQQYLHDLTVHTHRYASDLGLRLASPQDSFGPITAFHLPDHADPFQVDHELRKEGIIASPTRGVIRFAPHFYNTYEDVERAVRVLSGIVHPRSVSSCSV